MKKKRDILLEMAYSRKEFKDKIEEYLGGALLEFYKSKLAIKLGETKWVAHWQTEVTSLLRSFYLALRHTTKSKFNKQKALLEIAEYIQKDDKGWQTGAVNQIKRDFKLQKLNVSIEKKDTEEFWEMVWSEAEIAEVPRPLKDIFL